MKQYFKADLSDENIKRIRLVTVILALTGIIPLLIGGLIPLFLWCLPMEFVRTNLIKSKYKLISIILFNCVVTIFVAGLIAGTEYHVPVLG